MKLSKRITLGASVLLATAGAVLAFLSVSSNQEPALVLRAKVNIPMGQTLSASDFEEIQLSSDLAGLYAKKLSPGSVALRSVYAGEILPSGSVSNAPSLNRVKVTIAPKQLPVSDLQTGESLELWAVKKEEEAAKVRPVVSLLSPDAVIVQKPADASGFGVSTNTIDVLISRVDLTLVLEALADDGTEFVLVRNPSV